MDDKKQSSSVHSPTTYAGAFAAISTALVRMFVPAPYLENTLSITAALSPIIGMGIFQYLNSRKKTNEQIAFEERIDKEMAFLDTQINDPTYTEEQRKEFTEQKFALAKERITYNHNPSNVT
ncbi:hypothetical protein QJU89_05895 [Pasteurella skyensis]|uniref:Uncharacterized protein n=1 Tax=Phocoenobacter skyensis TaxID=97481 RepID=A0AAJ6P0H6_9PAST|nr:hypothetical protein [Pasteurella skyensis]MDP8162823.1 hypothetical protein [Pasteurella skyensis]MDP8172590.1 hypothetical protein [Pasteurella skyensis]MDP8179090.1 hypothetical protein [Pasteurella skyensis]MDP8183225.1 hypothetical protein [Pasteurella skyensis]MDP8189276.1 hypothetical protein [Pasteurella skyensis]